MILNKINSMSRFWMLPLPLTMPMPPSTLCIHTLHPLSMIKLVAQHHCCPHVHLSEPVHMYIWPSCTSNHVHPILETLVWSSKIEWMDGNEYDIEHENKQKCHIPQETRVDQVGSLVVEFCCYLLNLQLLPGDGILNTVNPLGKVRILATCILTKCPPHPCTHFE